MWNERDASDPFTAAYGSVVRSTRRRVGSHKRAGREVLLTSPLFSGACVRFRHSSRSTRRGCWAGRFRLLTPPGSGGARGLAAALKSFGRFQQQGRVDLQYETSVYLARRAAGNAKASGRK